MIVNRAREERKLHQLIHNYCAAIDTQDWDMVRACFAKDAIIKHEAFSGPANQFIDFAKDIISQTESCTHKVETVEIDFEGDIAVRKTRFSSCQQISGKLETLGPVITNGVDVEWRVKGRYLDRLRLADGSWEIIERLGYHDHMETRPL